MTWLRKTALDKEADTASDAPLEVNSDMAKVTEDEPQDVFCPMCDGQGTYLGAMGNRQHFRCRNCGMDFSNANITATAEKTEEETFCPGCHKQMWPCASGPKIDKCWDCKFSPSTPKP